jgi:chromosome segregation ATPase
MARVRISAALLAALLLPGCQTDNDPRAGGFIEGVSNLSSGGYETYVGERQARLNTTQDQAKTLEARAQSIAAERDALDRALQDASDELYGLQRRLGDLRRNLDTTRRQTDAERRRLDEATRKAASARAKIDALRAEPTTSVSARRESVDDLKALIGSVAAMVKELSG